MGFFDFFDHLEIFDGVWTDFSEIEDVYNGCMVGVCVICAGIAAGLTVGLLSLDITKLEIKLMIGNDAEKEAASSILPIVKQHHLLLVTLLLFNSIANETLPIFLGALVPNYIAVILSVTLVLIFGEIIPSALFTGPDQLLTAAKLTNLVYFLLFFFYPISWPLSKILDLLFGLEENAGSITREELEALVLLQSDAGEAIISELTSNSRGNSGRGNASASNSVPSSPIRYNSKSNSNNNRKNHHHEIQVMNEESPLLSRATSNDLPNNNSNKGYSSIQKTNKALTRIAEKAEIPTTSNATTASSAPHSHSHSHPHSHPHPQYSLTINEVSLMTGILRLSKFTVKDAMIPIRRVSMISSSTRLDEKSLYDILDSGFSRIPVYKRHDKQHILGYLLVKELIVINPIDNTMIESLKLREPLCVKPTIDLMDLLSLFQEGRSHLAVVTPNPMKTLECMRKGIRPTEKEAVMGIVTMEDVLEKMIQREITDETDVTMTGITGAGSAMTAPMMLYYNPNKSKTPGSTNPQRSSFPSKSNHRRPRIFAAGSVVTSDYYLANRMEYFGNSDLVSTGTESSIVGKEDAVRIVDMKNFSHILGDDGDKHGIIEEDDGENSPLVGKGRVKYDSVKNDEIDV